MHSMLRYMNRENIEMRDMCHCLDQANIEMHNISLLLTTRVYCVRQHMPTKAQRTDCSSQHVSIHGGSSRYWNARYDPMYRVVQGAGYFIVCNYGYKKRLPGTTAGTPKAVGSDHGNLPGNCIERLPCNLKTHVHHLLPCLP